MNKLVDIKVTGNKIQIFVKGQEVELKDFALTNEEESAKVKAKYSLNDTEYMMACFEIRRSLHE